MPLQLPLFTPACTWIATPVSALPSWAGAKRVAVDVETRDDHLRKLGIGVRRGGYITGVSFSIEDGPSHYLPVRHEGGDNLPVEEVFNYVRAQAKAFEGDVVGAKLDYDLDYLSTGEGVNFGRARYFRDIQVADPLINELHDSYSLDNIAKRHGLPGKDESILRQAAADYRLDPKKGMWQLPARFVGAYAEADTSLPLLILRKQERRIDELDLWGIYNLESQVLPILVKMRQRGVLIDQDQLSKMEAWALSEETTSLETLFHQTGIRVAVGDVWKKDGLSAALRAVGIEPGKTKDGKDQVDKELLKNKHPAAQAISWARKTNKLRTTFVASIREHMVNGRIHCTFNQIAREDDDGDMKGARYGRLSCVDPNLQQQSARDTFAKAWRSTFTVEKGKIWCCADYSQQEPRWTTHFAALMNLPGARDAAQAYRDNPLLDNHDFMAQLTGLDRKFAKNIYLGLCYGEGGAKLCRDCGLPTRWALSTGSFRERRMQYFATREEAIAARAQATEGRVYEAAGEEGQAIIDKFDARAPFIRKLAGEAQKVAGKRGFIITGGGRHLHFPQRDDGSYDWAHKALNRIIQGTSADQMKKALVEVDKAGFELQLQVHDELDLPVNNNEEALQIGRIMRDVMPAGVPFRVDVETGPNWGYIEKVAA